MACAHSGKHFVEVTVKQQCTSHHYFNEYSHVQPFICMGGCTWHLQFPRHKKATGRYFTLEEFTVSRHLCARGRIGKTFFIHFILHCLLLVYFLKFIEILTMLKFALAMQTKQCKQINLDCKGEVCGSLCTVKCQKCCSL